MESAAVVNKNGQTSYGYTGEQFHAGTGLLYLRARYYSPALHAFTSRDPFVGSPTVPASLHGYSYAHNNPILYTDPTGESVGGTCLLLALTVGAPLPIVDEAACLLVLAAEGIIIYTVATNPAVQHAATDLTQLIADTCISAFRSTIEPKLLPIPVPTLRPIPRPQPEPQPERKVDFLPIPTPNDRAIEKHISLGFNRVGSKSPLWELTFRLNLQLNPQGIYVYSYGGIDPQQGGWFENGLSSVTTLANFSQAFDDATQNAAHIHFTLEGITNHNPDYPNIGSDPIRFIEIYGKNGYFNFNKDGLITAVELYRIKHNGLCHKTTFYENNLKSPLAWHRICTR